MTKTILHSYLRHGVELQCWPVLAAIQYTQNMHVEWKSVTGNPQVTRKLTELAKLCCPSNTIPTLALRISVATSHVTCWSRSRSGSRSRPTGSWKFGPTTVGAYAYCRLALLDIVVAVVFVPIRCCETWFSEITGNVEEKSQRAGNSLRTRSTVSGYIHTWFLIEALQLYDM